MWKKFQTSLALKVASLTVLSAAVLGLFVSTFQIWSNYQDRNLQVQESLTAILSTTLPSISLATYNFNTQLNTQLTEGLISHPYILNASIIDSKGAELAVARSQQICTPNTLAIMLHGSNVRFESALAHRDIPLGKLILELDTCKRTELFIDGIVNSLISNLTLSILIALFIYFIFFRLVSAPITRLIERLQSMDPNAIEYASINKIKAHRPDELGVLVEQFAELLRTVHDHISRLKSAEKTINTYSANLEGLVTKRTQALTQINRQLKQSNAELENSRQISDRLNKTKFKLLSNLSRQFTPPLNAIINQLSQADSEDEQFNAAIKECEQFISVLTELNGVISLRTDSRKQCSPIHLRVIAERVKQRLAEFPGTSPEVIFEIDEQLSDSHIGDGDQIEQLIFNLVANTLHHSFKNQARVEIRENQRSVVFSFSAHQLEISELSFDQILNTSQGLHHGPIYTAMGLALGKDLVEVAGGNIHILHNSRGSNELLMELPLPSSDEQLKAISNQLPQGGIRLNINNPELLQQTRQLLNEWQLPYFIDRNKRSHPVLLITDSNRIDSDAWLVIGIGHPFERKNDISNVPLIALNDNPGNGELYRAIQEGCEKELHNNHQQQKPRVLVVEDNTINRMLSQRFLKNLNCDVEIAEDGDQAVRMANRLNYDLIFMDCQMPVMDGFQATRQIRRSNQNQGTPIVALTGLDSDNERQACLQAGMNDFITKPFTQDQLANALLQWLPQQEHPDFIP